MSAVTIDAKTSLILALIKMARVDDHVNHFEQMNITMLTNTLGVDHATISLLRNDLDSFKISPPETYEQKVEYFWRILTMMKMDMQAHDKEIKLCLELGIALGLPKHEVQALTNYMAGHLNKFIKIEKFEEKLVELKNTPGFEPDKSLMTRLFDWFNISNINMNNKIS
jgi:uncharacterized tellurite resistance protein B-like protein